jgi:hypothetical protein
VALVAVAAVGQREEARAATAAGACASPVR